MRSLVLKNKVEISIEITAFNTFNRTKQMKITYSKQEKTRISQSQKGFSKTMINRY